MPGERQTVKKLRQQTTQKLQYIYKILDAVMKSLLYTKRGAVVVVVNLLLLLVILNDFADARPPGEKTEATPAPDADKNINAVDSKDANNKNTGQNNNNHGDAGGKDAPPHKRQQPPPSVEAATIIAQHPACVEDVKRICRRNDQDDGNKEEKKIIHNFEVLDCFLSYEGDETPPSGECQSVRAFFKGARCGC